MKTMKLVRTVLGIVLTAIIIASFCAEGFSTTALIALALAMWVLYGLFVWAGHIVDLHEKEQCKKLLRRKRWEEDR